MRFLLFSLILLVLTGQVFAASTASDELFLSGSVSSDLSIDIIPVPLSVNLDLGIPNDKVKVADVTVISNSESGYNITWSSLNDGFMKHIAQSQAKVSYGISSEVMIAGVLTETEVYDLSIPVVFGDDNGAAVSYTAPVKFTSLNKMANLLSLDGDVNYMLSGIYRDTVTATIQAN